MNWDGSRLRFREKSPFTVMLKQNRLDPTLGFFWGIVLLHVIVWTIIASKTQPNVPHRTLELLTAGRELAWGYPTHPPLAVWVTSIASQLAAPRLWPIYLMAQICGVVSVWSAWVVARKFLHPWTAVCGAIVLLGGYSCTIASSEFSSTHLASAFWSLSILAFHEALTEGRRRYWAATGVLLALGFLTSYGTLLLLITMFMFTLWNDHARRCWDSSWPFLAGLMMAAVMLPHLFWLAQNDFITIQSRLAPAASVAHHLEQPLAYLGTQLLCLIPVLLLLTPLVAWFSFEEPATRDSEERDFARQYLLWVTCLPPAVIFVLSLLAGPASTLFAGVTNWTYLGIALLLWAHLSETRLSWRRSLLRIGSSVGVFAAALIAINLMLPHLSRKAFNTHFPGRELARGIENAWQSYGYKGPVPVVAGPRQLVRNAVWNARQSSKVALYDDMIPNAPQGPMDQTLIEKGGVIVWKLDSEDSPGIQQLIQRFGKVSLANPIAMNWNGIADIPELQIGLAVVHPTLAQITTPAPNPLVSAPATTLPPNYPRAGTIPTQPMRNLNPSVSMPQSTGSPLPPLQSTGLSGTSSIPASYQYPADQPNTPANSLPSNPLPTANSNPTGSSALKGFDWPTPNNSLSTSGPSNSTLNPTSQLPPAGQSTIGQPSMGQPSISQPSMGQPTTGQSSFAQPSSAQPTNSWNLPGNPAGSSLPSQPSSPLGTPRDSLNDPFAKAPASSSNKSSLRESTGLEYSTGDLYSRLPSNNSLPQPGTSGNSLNQSLNSLPQPTMNKAPSSTSNFGEVLPEPAELPSGGSNWGNNGLPSTSKPDSQKMPPTQDQLSMPSSLTPSSLAPSTLNSGSQQPTGSSALKGLELPSRQPTVASPPEEVLPDFPSLNPRENLTPASASKNNNPAGAQFNRPLEADPSFMKPAQSLPPAQSLTPSPAPTPAPLNSVNGSGLEFRSPITGLGNGNTNSGLTGNSSTMNSGSASTGKVPEYQFSREFLEKYPELAPAPGSPGSQSGNALPPLKTSTPDLDPFAGSALPSTPSSFNRNSSTQGTPSSLNPLSLPSSSQRSMDLNDALPAANSYPAGINRNSGSLPTLAPVAPAAATPLLSPPSSPSANPPAPAGLTEQ